MAATVEIERPKIAKIDCKHCCQFAYQLEEGHEREGLPILVGDEMIPVSKPPCHDDDKICPKVRPGHSDFTPESEDIYWYWRLCCNLDDHPDDVWYKRWRRILDGVVEEVRHRRQERIREEQRRERDAMMNRKRDQSEYF